MGKKDKKGSMVVYLILSLFIFPVLACSQLEKKKESLPEIVYDLTPMVELTKVSYFLKKLEGSPKLFFEIGIKNVSKESHKFRVTVFLKEGPSGSALYPIKGNLDSNKELVQNFPFFYDKLPKGFTLTVETYD